MRVLFSTFIFAVLFGISACEKAEKPIQLSAKPLDSVSLVQVNLGENYEDQVYVNFLEKNFIKSVVKNNCWDLAFDCSLESNKINMNGGKGVFIGVVGKENFLTNIKINDIKWRWDESSGGDSIVLKNWCNPITGHSFDSVYIIDRGPDVELSNRYFQFKVNIPSLGMYKVEAADLNGKKLFSVLVNKNPYKNQVFLNFSEAKILDFEPKSIDWQFCFLRARWVYYEFNPPLIYTVTGIQINSRILSVAVDSSMTFDEISKRNIGSMKFSNKRDIIGFDWKIYDFGSGRYLTRKYVNYILKSKIYPFRTYKLRFTDYYSKLGVKGSPKFEVVELK